MGYVPKVKIVREISFESAKLMFPVFRGSLIYPYLFSNISSLDIPILNIAFFVNFLPSYILKTKYIINCHSSIE